MRKLIRNSMKIGILVMVVTALIMTVAIPAGAATAPPTNPLLHTVQGKVTSISGTSSLVIQNGNQSPVTINVDGSTKYYQLSMDKAQGFVNNTVAQDNKQAQKAGKPLPPLASDLKRAHIPTNWRDNLGWLDTFDTAAHFSDIQVGDTVIARTTNDANNLAKQILIIHAPVIQTVRGTISAVSSNSTTITPANLGTPVTVGISDKTVVTLKGLLSVQVNQYAVAVYNKNTLVAQTLNVQATAPTPPPVANLTSITVTSAVSGNFTVGSNSQFGATGTYSNGSTFNITSQVSWASSNPAVATISNTGLAHGIGAGSTNITASKNGIISPAVTLTVSGQ